MRLAARAPDDVAAGGLDAVRGDRATTREVAPGKRGDGTNQKGCKRDCNNTRKQRFQRNLLLVKTYHLVWGRRWLWEERCDVKQSPCSENSKAWSRKRGESSKT